MDGYYSLLSLLARQSNTTAMPDGMAVIIKEHPTLSAELKEWYRLRSQRGGGDRAHLI
jgi:hypothetical protein